MQKAFVLLLAVYAVSSALWAATSAKLEAEAGKEDNPRAATKTWLQAANQRIAEAKELYAKKDADELDLDAETDDELDPGASSTATTRQKDTEARHYLQTAVDFDYGGKPLVAEEYFAKAEAVQGVSKETTEAIKKERARIAKERDPADTPDPKKPKKPVYHKDLNAALARVEAAKAKCPAGAKMRRNATKEEKQAIQGLAGAWSDVGYQAFLDFNPALMVEARENVEKLGCQPSRYAYLWTKAPAAYDNLKVFPRSEEETRAPRDFGVKATHTIIVGELDWDAEDATACVEEALASGATTVVFEDKGSPWYIRTMKPRANQRLVFKKGVKILRDRVSRQNREKAPMIQLKGVKNVILEGEGGPNDVYIGTFENLAAREKQGSDDYGGSGIGIGGARNCIIRNLTIGATEGSGISFGGGFDIWIENVVLKENYMQGMSICDAGGLYCRNVSFLNTQGGDPACGIDFEPNYEIEANYDCYFYDCTFAGNAGGAVNWSSSSYFPVTAHFKRCHFGDQPAGAQIVIFARCGVYMERNARAPSKIVLEDITMEGKTPKTPIVISNSNLFDVEVKGLKAKNATPIIVSLGRDYSMFPYYEHAALQGRVSFKDVALEGAAGQPFIEVQDKIGTYSVSGFSGSGTMNGEVFDCSKLSYVAPQKDLAEQPRLDTLKLAPPSAASAPAKDAKRPASFFFIYSGSWFSGGVNYRAVYYDKGWKAKKILQGTASVADLGLGAFPVAYSARGGDSIFKLESPGNRKFRLYFEVPPKRSPAVLRVQSWPARVYDAAGKLVKAFPRTQCVSYCTCESSGEKGEIWSIECDGAAILKFFAPFTGLVAESPEALPRQFN